MTDHQPNLSQRDLQIGVPAVLELRGLNPERRAEITVETMGYLALCNADELLVAGQNVEALYARSSTRTAGFGVEEGDVFGRAAVDTLMELKTHESARLIETIKRARHIVGAQQHKYRLPPLGTRLEG